MYAEPSTGKPKLIIFASGAKESGSSHATPLGFSKTGYRQENLGGGSGFENLVRASREGILDADIVAVASNHEHGSVRNRADRLGIKFIYFPGPYESENYTKIITDTGADWIALSGWFQMVKGLDPAKTFNIHPALLSCLGGRFGGKGMYGDELYQSIRNALEKGEIAESGCSMHFVTEDYDVGPVFFEYPIPLDKGLTAKEIEKAIREVEHDWQPKITNMVVHGEIRWDGKERKSLVVPQAYKYLPR